MAEEKENKIGKFYDGLGRGEKGKFLLWVMTLTGYSYGTVTSRVRDNKWSPLERKTLADGVENGSWRNL